MSTLERVPLHLRQYVVEQDYAQYSAMDQAVWRFVLLQLYSRLRDTAHPAYSAGLERAGMSTERIPRLDEMDARLNELGWGAVCVDGFIPPRAFVEFQAQAILPIAAEIRTRQHLPYTPAPDIIHEAAGHAPILPDPGYARFLRRIGAVGQRAFALPEDDAVYRTIRALSEIKEDPAASAQDVERSEQALSEAVATATRVSEAARVARLYWWTVEYGLVGTPRDYRLYGAGLLSSLGESHGCHASQIRKLPLSAACVDVSYDITRPQPQLFVASGFDELDDVLREVEAGLSVRLGGAHALETARASRELASVELDTGAQIIGVVDAVELADESPALVRWRGPVALASSGKLLDGEGTDRDGYVLPLGASRVTGAIAAGASVRVDYVNGLSCSGRALREIRAPDGRMLGVELEAAVLSWGERVLFRDQPRCTLLFAERVVSAWAGAADPGVLAATAFSGTRVPRPRRWSVVERELERLYVRARTGDADAVRDVHARLSREYPEEWLLRWNLLETLTRQHLAPDLRQRLEAELLKLEVDYAYEQPIASGLRYLGLRAA